MAHLITQPLMRPIAAPPFSGASYASAPPQLMEVAYTMPDASDARYPRRWWLRALRALASAWWAPILVYLAQAATIVLQAEQSTRFAAPPDGALVAQALRVDWAPLFILEQPAGLPLIAVGVVALLLALTGAVAAGRWASADRRREAQVLMFRLARPEERMNPAFVRQALGPALAWRLRTARIRRRVATLLLATLSIAAGALIALNALPIGG